MLRAISSFLIAGGVTAAFAFALAAQAAETTFTDPANDVVRLADGVPAFDPDINPGGVPVAGHPTDITAVTANVTSTIDICVLRPNKTAVSTVTHVEIILLGVNLQVRWRLEDGTALETFVENFDDLPVYGTGITIASADGGKTVCLTAPVSLASSITGIRAVAYDRPSEGELRGWDRTSVFTVQLEVPTATPTSTPPPTSTATETATPTATATSTATASPTATATTTDTPVTTPTAPPPTSTPTPPTVVATATATASSTAVAPGPPSTGNGAGGDGQANGLVPLAIVIVLAGAAGATVTTVARRRR